MRAAETTLDASCCIVGGGPAGMMLGFLLARQGVATIVIEKHESFIDDFRGDMIHPATMEAMADLGFLDEFLRMPHQKTREFVADFGGIRTPLADFSGIKSAAPFIAFLPQDAFLGFLAAKARQFPSFRLLTGTRATSLLNHGGRVAGVRASREEEEFEIRARITVGADGRGSQVRAWAGLPLKEIGSPIDVFWMRIARSPGAIEDSLRIVRPGRILSVIDRGDYFQCGYVMAKGSAGAVRARGIDAFRRDLCEMAPMLAPGFGELRSFDDAKLLSVSVNRLKKWGGPGVLCIGDAAHAMSPVSGVGVNLAVQDAIAAAAELGPALLRGETGDQANARVERRRKLPSILTQMMQGAFERGPIAAVLRARGEMKTPLAISLLRHSRWLRRRAGELIGMGVRLERVRP
ncbi:MAG: FAD-dependent oxidoreductase [Parvularculaceae bacterium]